MASSRIGAPQHARTRPVSGGKGRIVIPSLHIPPLSVLAMSVTPRKLLVSVFALSLSASLLAARTSPAQTLPDEPLQASADQLRTLSSAIPVDTAYPTQILLEEATYRIADDGAISYRHRLLYRVDSSIGVDNWSEVSMQWDPWFENPAVLQARVLEPSGSFAELDPKTITDAPVKADDSETFSSEHVRRAPLPGVSIGAIVEEVVTVDEKTPYFAAGSLYRFRFSSGVPAARVRVIVDAPSALPYKDLILDLPNLSIQRTESAGRRHIVYEQTSVAAAQNSDIDLSTNAPGYPMVEFATGASWKAINDAYAKMADPQMVPSETQAILPTDLPTDRMERIRAIVSKLHEEVRYTGVEFGAAKLTPQRPSEVIQRHYGDCKDKATLLVAMLRQAGIPANIALLSTGPGINVDPALPGMTQFNHAIVYVPAQDKAKPVWIDATAEFFQPGVLPFDDDGRNALVISPDTTALTRTPDPSPADSTVTETRTFTLAEFGPSSVVESSETHGIIDANYRANYGGNDPRIRESLDNYAKTAYYAKGLTNYTHGDAHDLSKPFTLTLNVKDAHRGVTVMEEALVAVFPNIVFDSLPQWFKTTPPVVGPNTTDDARHEMQLASAARAKTYTMRPFIDERRYRILIPDGFALRTLPPNKTTQLGPATLTETYAIESPHAVTATLHLDTGSGNLTADDAIAMRSAVLEFDKRDYVGIYFDQTAAKAFAEGHVRTALDTDRALITAHPEEALHHVRLARLLLEAGIGDLAHAEALKATQLDPKSSTAFYTYGWTLEHDSLGVRFGKGYDRPGAIAALKKAIELDADDNDPRFDLAILDENDTHGIRYAPDADLPAAIAVYRDLLTQNKDKDASALTQYQNNLLFALFFNKQFSEVDTLLATTPASNTHSAVAIATAVAQHGVPAGIAAADKGNVEANDRNSNLRTAGTMLAQLRMYTEASAILQAGIGGGDDAPTTARQIEMYKNLKPATLKPLPATDPAQPVQTITFGMMAGTLTPAAAEAALAHHAYSSPAALQRDVDRNIANTGFLSVVARKSDVTEPVLLDLIAGNMTYTATGDDATGHPVVVTTPGSEDNHFFVVREDGAYRMVASSDNDTSGNVPVGNYALYLLSQKNDKSAKALLDWKRDLTHRQGNDDPFYGPLLPRFWTVDSSKPGADSPEAMRLAAISLLAGSMDAKPFLAELVAEREKASGQRQTDMDILIAVAADGAEQPDIALAAAKRLLDQEPDSLTALRLAGEAYAFQNDAKGWLAMLAPRLARKPKDHDLLSEQARAYQTAKDYSAARTAEQGVLDSGKANDNDYNTFAWLGLFDNHTGDAELKAAQQSNMLSKNGSFADLHTLACIYATEGHITEARQVLDQAMYAGSEPEPNSAVWYALGLIYEQYGATDAALAAYNKVQAHELDDHTYIDPASTWLLAQDRIHALAKPTPAKNSIAQATH
jgi:tetratricopeptide (TPR) repeat protein